MTDEQREAIKTALEACRADRARAVQMIDYFKKGERHFRATGNGPFQEVTDKHRKQYEGIVENIDRLIAAYEALDA